LGVSKAGVESVGVIFPCNEYGFDMEVAGRFCVKASVDWVAFPTDLCGAVDNAVAEGTFLGAEGGRPVCLETENATRESGRFCASVGRGATTLLLDATGICLRGGAGVITAAENSFFSVARGFDGGTGVLVSPT
jgi:hypothetical protein